ncbi:MAG: glucose-6-phosphate isomerase [Bacteriovoracaceae bacterium]
MLNWEIRSSHSLPKISNIQHDIEAYHQTISSSEIGFFELAKKKELLLECKQVYEKFCHKKYFIHIGIGGSALGPEMLLSALGNNSGVDFIFLNNIDPDEFERNLMKIDLKESLIYVVSKSGTTAETVAAMSILVNELKKIGVKESEFKDYFVFCTDPEKGDLRSLAQKWHVTALSIPSNVGGRYSVLSPVGLLPALFAGIDAKEILEGAIEAQTILSHESGNDFYQLAAWIKELHDQNIKQTVMMPYSSLLKNFSAWFVQLWAESLGKEGKGLTPIPAYGATDQHSQMQLFMEGPNDKLLIIIEVEKFQHNYSLSNSIEGESFNRLSQYSLSELMKAELEGTLAALNENGRHVLRIKVPQLNECFLGQLILFSECLTVMVGKMLKIDPFNQPGVEAGKKYAYAWLKSLK